MTRKFRPGEDSFVRDINMMPALMAALPAATEKAVSEGAQVIKEAMEEVYASQGGPSKWRENAPLTISRKGEGKQIMEGITGALSSSIEIRQNSPVKGAGDIGIASAERHIGWFDELHPTAKKEDKFGGATRLTFGQLAWMHELGFEQDDGRHVPARPWASVASDMSEEAVMLKMFSQMEMTFRMFEIPVGKFGLLGSGAKHKKHTKVI